MDYQFWSTFALNVVGVGIMIWQVRLSKQQLLALPSPRSDRRIQAERRVARKLYTPVFLMGGLILLSWLPYAINAWRPTPLPALLVGWSGFDKGCRAAVNTSPIVKFKDKYRLFIICNIPDPRVDSLQDERIAISKPFSITGGVVDIAVPYAAESPIAEMAKIGTTTNFNVVLLPMDKDASSIRRLADVDHEGGAILLPGTTPRL